MNMRLHFYNLNILPLQLYRAVCRITETLNHVNGLDIDIYRTMFMFCAIVHDSKFFFAENFQEFENYAKQNAQIDMKCGRCMYVLNSIFNFNKIWKQKSNYFIMGTFHAPPPPTQCYLGTHMLVPSFWSTPYLRTANISKPPFRGHFAGFSCLGDPPKSGKMLNVPP